MATEVVKITDGTNTVDFLDGTYIYQNIQGLDPPPVEIIYSGDKPVHRKWKNREITIVFGISATTTVELEQKKRTITTIIENTYRYWVTYGQRGDKAQFQYRADGGTDISYANIFWGDCDWGRVEYSEGAKYAYQLKGAQLILICEPFFHPNSTTNLVNAVTFYNHDDAGHDNYTDIAAANIKGDVEAPVRVHISTNTGKNPVRHMLARKSQGTVANFIHALEFEDGTDYAWVDAIDSYASGGDISLNAANADGYILWTITTNLDDYYGRFRAYARLWTNDIANTQFKLEHGQHSTTHENYIVGDWQWLTKVSYWQWLFLDTVIIPTTPLPSGTTPADVALRVHYEKDEADTVKGDWLMLMPEDESAILADVYVTDVDNNYEAEFDWTQDFPYTYSVKDSYYYERATIRGRMLTVQPGVLNRIYWHGEIPDQWPDPTYYYDEVHEGTDLQVTITIDYLPQYLTPLE